MKKIGDYCGSTVTLYLFLMPLFFIFVTQSAEADPLIQSRSDQPEKRDLGRALKAVQQGLEAVKYESERIAGGTLAVKKMK
jgi:hypothetical protein